MIDNDYNKEADNDDDDDDNNGITFSSNKDKEKILSYLADSNDLHNTAQKFNISHGIIQNWLLAASQHMQDGTNQGLIDEKPKINRTQKFESAFYRPLDNKTVNTTSKSAFSKMK